MQVILNGENHTLSGDLTVNDLLNELSLEGKLAIEINEEIVPRSRYNETIIKPGDRIEVVHAVGGG
ncbi:MAG: sulfur carrier protein ThiS [Gammaproteobacteria bacterium]|nr:sulfur carrier protein ThiS [Gammaproteobacteria bacterium]